MKIVDEFNDLEIDFRAEPSEREKEICVMLANGETKTFIAKELKITKQMVNKIVKSLKNKIKKEI